MYGIAHIYIHHRKGIKNVFLYLNNFISIYVIYSVDFQKHKTGIPLELRWNLKLYPQKKSVSLVK